MLRGLKAAIYRATSKLMSPTLMCVNCARQDLSGISGPRWINSPLEPETPCQVCGLQFMDGSLQCVAGGEGDMGDTFFSTDTGESSRPSIPETTAVATNTTLFTRLVRDKDSLDGDDKFVMVQLRFYVGLCKAGKEVIRKAILAHGGALELHPGTNDDDIIALIEPLSRVSRFGRVVYSVDFVNACIDAGKILDLAPFRLGSRGAMERTPDRLTHNPRSNLGEDAVSPNRRPRSPLRAPPSNSGALSPIDKRSSSKQASRQNREALRGAVRVAVQNLVKQTGISARRAFRALRKEKGDYDRALRLAMRGEGLDSL